MPIAIRLILFTGISIALAYAINTYGFGLAHSSEWGYLAFLFSPGIIMIFIHGSLGEAVSWTLLILINIFYYEAIYRFFWQKHTKHGVKS